MEWRKKFGLKSFEDVATKNEVFLTQGKQVTAIRSLGRCCKPQEKSRRKVLYQCSIAGSGSVMELINDNIVKSIWSEMA